MFIKLTKTKDMFIDPKTGEKRKYDNASVYVNHTFITRISRSYNSGTIVEIHGTCDATWCEETPEQIYAACQAADIVKKEGDGNAD